jgi:hypothetical protein
MRRSRQSLKVNKVPLETKGFSYPQDFSDMPRLYLEIIENKDKIKQDLINIEHTVNYNSTEKYIKPEEPIMEPVKEINEPQKNEPEIEVPKTVEKEEETVIEVNEQMVEEPVQDDTLSARLQELLGDGSDTSVGDFSPQSKMTSPNTEPINSPVKSPNMRSAPVIKSPIIKSKSPTRVAPTLKEIEKSNNLNTTKNLRNLNSPDENEVSDEDAKREILFKFDLLRKSYPASSIPEYSIHTDLYVMQRSYKDCVRRLSLDSSVESYKTYLVYGFMGCEFIFGNFLGFDMSGFTQQQIISMHSYEKLLIEIGEKSYIPTEENWPVEVRLLFTIIMNAAFFIVSKMMMQKTGTNLMNMVNNMNGSKINTQKDAPKRKMRGPNL